MTKNWAMPRKRLFCQENDTRSGRRFACRLYPSHGPLWFIASHSFRARLRHAKNEAPEEEAVSSPCSKSPHAHITERPRKHESEARVLIWRPTRFVRGRLITKILHLSERVTHLHIAVPTKTRFYASRIHVLKNVN